MQRETERLVLFFDLTLEAHSVSRTPGLSVNGLTPKSLGTLLEWVRSMSNVGPGKLAWTRRDDREVFYLADIDVDETAGYATLLINRCDKRASDIILFNPDSDVRRRIRRDPGEGADFSSHVLISLRQRMPNQYLVLVEQGPGLSSGRIEAFVNYLLRISGTVFKSELIASHPGGISVKGKPYQIRMRHRCKLDGHPAPSFIRDLEAGTLRDMELISTHNRNAQWDANGYIIEKSKVVKVAPAGSGVLGAKMAAIRDLCNAAVSENYEKVKIRFKTSSELTRTVTLDAHTQGIARDSIYVRREIIEGFGEPLPSAFESINEEIKGKLTALL